MPLPSGIPLPKPTAPGLTPDFYQQLGIAMPTDPSQRVSQIGKGTYQSPGQTFTLQDILAGKVGGAGATVTGAPAGYSAPAGWSATAPTYTPDATQATNLGAYGVQPDQFANPPSSDPLAYLGLPNYGANMGGNNSDNGFASLFGAPDQTSFLSGWT